LGILYYNDPVLNEAVVRLMRYNKESCFEALNECTSRFKPNPTFDARYLIATGILSCIIHNCPSRGVDCTPYAIKAQMENIVGAIPASIRWKTFDTSDKFQRWLLDFDPKKATRKDFSLLNEFEELFLGVVSFTDMEMRNSKKVAKAFEKYVEEFGFKDYDVFCRALTYLLDMEERFEQEPSLYVEKEINDLEIFLGIKKSSIALGEEDVNKITLENLPKRIIPIFFGGRPMQRRGFQRQPLSGVNIPQRLCYGLRKPREEIIEGAFKGSIFEDFLSNVLQGFVVIAVKPSIPMDGYLQRVDNLEKLPGGGQLISQLKKKRMTAAWETVSEGYEYYLSESEIPGGKKRLTRPYVYLRYDYTLPKGQFSCQLKIKEKTKPAFKKFLMQRNVSEWEEDILLLHDSQPRHCLIAQAKFTIHYSHSKYLEASRHAMATVNYLRDNSSAKQELNIPEDMPIIPAVFTSYTGAIHKLQDRVLKCSIFFVLRDRFFTQVNTYLDCYQELESQGKGGL
jgi:hypothetical protein